MVSPNLVISVSRNWHILGSNTDLVNAILDDVSCQKPSQADVDAMRAAVGAGFVSLVLERQTHSFISAEKRQWQEVDFVLGCQDVFHSYFYLNIIWFSQYWFANENGVCVVQEYAYYVTFWWLEADCCLTTIRLVYDSYNDSRLTIVRLAHDWCLTMVWLALGFDITVYDLDTT